MAREYLDGLLDALAACDLADAAECAAALVRADEPVSGPVTLPHDLADADPVILLAVGRLLAAGNAVAAAREAYRREAAAVVAMLAAANEGT